MPATEACDSSNATKQPSFAQLVLVTALLSKQKSLSEQGRKFTPGVWRRFDWQTAAEELFRKVVHEAKRLISKGADENPSKLVVRLMVQEFLHLQRRSGRPPKKKGLIGPLLQNKKTTRMTTAEERTLARFVFGHQCRLYAKKHSRNDYRDFYNLICYDGLAEIDEIPLAEAIRRAMQDPPPPLNNLFKGRSLGALKTHFSRNKRTRRLPQPK